MDKLSSLISDQFEVEEEQKRKEIEVIDSRISDVKSMLKRLRQTVLSQYCGLTDVDPSTRSDLVKSTELRFCVGGSSNGSAQSSTNSRSSQTREQLSVCPESSTERHRAASIFPEDYKRSLSKLGEGNDSSPEPQLYTHKRVIVGNTSRFIREDQREVNDKSTYKWMVYVRGSKEHPDISPFVSKIWFFLHPSYKPNDIVEVTHPPFHLTRRGWGEFHVRVRLFFRDKRYKPVDIMHTLSLDRTYTGLQTLGAETSVNLELDRQAFEEHSLAGDGDLVLPAAEGEDRTFSRPMSAQNQTPSTSTLSFCKEDTSIELSESAKQRMHLEHCYARPATSTAVAKMALAEARALQDLSFHQVTALLPADLTTRIGERLAAVGASAGAVSLEQALVEGVRFFPLVSSTQEKSIHPYVARNAAEFRSWTIGKQRACEWLRAVALRQYIESRPLTPTVHKATTRYIFTWCRAQGHSRLIVMGKTGLQSGVPRSPLSLCGLCGRLLANGRHDVHQSCRKLCANNGLTLSSCQPLLRELSLQQAAIGQVQHQTGPTRFVDVVNGRPERLKPRRFPTSFAHGKKQAISRAPLLPRYWCREVLSSLRLADAVKPPLDPKEDSVIIPYPAEVALNAACQCMLRDLVSAACELARSDSSSFHSGIAPTLTVFHIHAALSRSSHLDILSDSGLASLQS